MITVCNPSRLPTALTGLALALGTLPAFSGGFQINESSASGLGTAFAGGAAGAEDAGTMWSNVAGISRLRERQGVGALHLIKPSIKFRNGASLAAAGPGLGGEGGDAGGINAVPSPEAELSLIWKPPANAGSVPSASARPVSAVGRREGLQTVIMGVDSFAMAGHGQAGGGRGVGRSEERHRTASGDQSAPVSLHRPSHVFRVEPARRTRVKRLGLSIGRIHCRN